MPEATGDCYEAAFNYLMENRGGGAVLVHAEVTGQGRIEGVRYGHAWVEVGDKVIDRSNGRIIVMPPAIYYSLAHLQGEFLEYDRNMHRYTFDEAVQAIQKHGTYGPWDLKTSTGL